MALPPSSGAVQLTVAWPSPADAVGAPGVAGAVAGPVGAALLKTIVAASQGVLAPVPVIGFGVAPAPASTWSWTSICMSFAGETLARAVYAGSDTSALEKPESA